jgi:hypothetical protein
MSVHTSLLNDKDDDMAQTNITSSFDLTLKPHPSSIHTLPTSVPVPDPLPSSLRNNFRCGQGARTQSRSLSAQLTLPMPPLKLKETFDSHQLSQSTTTTKLGFFQDAAPATSHPFARSLCPGNIRQTLPN